MNVCFTVAFSFLAVPMSQICTLQSTIFRRFYRLPDMKCLLHSLQLPCIIMYTCTVTLAVQSDVKTTVLEREWYRSLTLSIHTYTMRVVVYAGLTVFGLEVTMHKAPLVQVPHGCRSCSESYSGSYVMLDNRTPSAISLLHFNARSLSGFPFLLLM